MCKIYVKMCVYEEYIQNENINVIKYKLLKTHMF